MKKNVRNALAISGIAIAIGTSGFVLEASANNGSRGHMQRSHQERILRARKFENNVAGRRVVMGTVTAVNDSSLTISRGDKTYAVNISSDTRLFDHNWKNISFSDIQKDDKVRVLGTISDSTITAKTVRDISIEK